MPNGASMIQAARSIARVLLLLPLVAAAAYAPLKNDAVALTGEDLDGVAIGHTIDYLVDSAGTCSFAYVKDSSADETWQRSEKSLLGFGFSNQTYWLRFATDNVTHMALEWYLEIAYGHLDDIRLYIPGRDGYAVESCGDLKPFRQRYFNHYNFIFPLTQPPGIAVYYLRIQSTSSMNLPINVWTRNKLMEGLGDASLILGIFYGILIVMFLYNLFIFFSIRDPSYLYYVSFIVIYILLTMALSAMGFQYLWPTMPPLCNSSPLFICLSIVMPLFFTRSFVNMSRDAPVSNKIYILMVYVNLTMAGLTFVLPYHYSVMFAAALMFITIAYIFTSLLYLYVKGLYLARLLLLGWSFLIVGTMLTILKNFGVLPNSFLTIWGVEMGGVCNMVLFSLGLADKIVHIRNDLSAANVKLEAEVHERSIQLTDALHRLDATNRQLEQAHFALWEEMQLAKRIQTALLPATPELRGYDIAAYMAPMAEVGGDYYDVINDEGRDWVCIGDVSGHGVSAGLVQMMAQTTIHVALSEGGAQLSPARLLSRINRTITRNIQLLGEGKYMTMTVLACIDQGIITFAGLHQDILIYRHERRTVEEVATDGIWLGIINDIDKMLNNASISLAPNDMLLLYTDGVTEAMQQQEDEHLELFGQERLCGLLHKGGEFAPQEMIASILGALGNYQCGDDVTLICIKRTSTQAREGN